MSNRDFIDDDLILPRPGAERQPAPAGAAERRPVKPDDDLPAGGSDLDIPALVRHRKQIDAQSATTIEELEKLRRKEEELQRQKRDLEDARRKHDDYAKGKDELIARLGQSLVGIERHEIRAEQTAQVLKTTRLRFRELLETLRDLRDDTWPEHEMRERLNEALASIDDARMEYNKATARIEAVLGGSDGEGGPAGAGHAALFDPSGIGDLPHERTFLEWMGIGFAVSLPLILVLGILGIFLVLHLLSLI